MFLFGLLQVFKHYFEELEEESLRDNFVVVVQGTFDFFFKKKCGWKRIISTGCDWNYVVLCSMNYLMK